MKMLLNNGMVINDAPLMSENTRKYLNQFWNFPSKDETEKKKDQHRVIDYKRSWQSKATFKEQEKEVIA